MKSWSLSVALAALLAIGAANAQSHEPFEFVALGDMPYNLPGDYEKFDRLIARVNAFRPAFTLHVGDIISGRTRCSDENLTRAFEQLKQFQGPLVYTPGDNEWTDCHRILGGRYDPMERLGFLRRLFFPRPGLSLGQKPLNVESQALQMADRFSAYVENVRFWKNGVLFASAHVVGSLNNYDERRPETLPEFEARNAANLAWIEDAFRLAVADGAKGLVLFWQANVHATPMRDPGAAFAKSFEATIKAVERGAASLRRPILVVHGDYHFFEVRPFLNIQKRIVPHVHRLQVFGDLRVHAVRVRVEPDDPAVFSFAPLYVPENEIP